jgi:hypothetical protein
MLRVSLYYAMYFVQNREYLAICCLSYYVQYWAFVRDGFEILFSVLNPESIKTYTRRHKYKILFLSLILKQN